MKKEPIASPISSTTSSGTPRKKRIPSNKMKTISIVAIAGFVLALAPAAQAAKITYSPTTTLTPDADDVSNFAGTDSEAGNVTGQDAASYLAYDRSVVGQTFTTGTNVGGYTFNAVSLQHVDYDSWFHTVEAATYTVRVTDPSSAGTAGFVLVSETASVDGTEPNQFGGGYTAIGTGRWLTLTLDSPITLAANTIYGFDAGALNGTNHLYFDTNGDGSTSGNYTGGEAYTSGVIDSGDGGGDDLRVLTGDRVFIAHLTAVTITSITSITSVDPPGTWKLELEGKPDTAYEFRSSPTLDFTPGDLVTGLMATEGKGTISGDSGEFVTTNGDGYATVQMALSGSPADFVRAQIPPPPPPVLEEYFEDDDGGFTFSSAEGTDWAWGPPDSFGEGGEVTEGNGSSTNCWATNLGTWDGGIGDAGFYADPTTDSCLRSPDFSLVGATTAELTFAEALDVDAGDTAVLKLFTADHVDLGIVYTAVDGDILTANWAAANGGTPIDISAGAGLTVYLQWCLSGTGDIFDDFMGWYIDDVVITGTP